MQLNKKVIHNQIATSIGVLAIGDVVGRVGRRCLTEGVDILRKKYEPNLVIANVENAAGGFGLTEKICEEFVFKHQIDVLTTGNHWCDKREILDFSKKYSNLIFPANMYNVDSISKGLYLGKIKGIFYAVINLTGTLFMKGENSSPFKAIDALLKLIPEYVSNICGKFLFGFFLIILASIIDMFEPDSPADSLVYSSLPGLIVISGISAIEFTINNRNTTIERTNLLVIILPPV